MQNRVTIQHLQSIVNRLNRITGSPLESYVRADDGSYVAQVGNYHLSQAYGGVCLHRMHNLGGGVSSPLSSGHVSKRELQSMLFAYIAGIQAQQDAQEPLGWKLVPVEPTPEMLEAAVEGFFAEVRPHKRKAAYETYKAMLGAAE